MRIDTNPAKFRAGLVPSARPEMPSTPEGLANKAIFTKVASYRDIGPFGRVDHTSSAYGQRQRESARHYGSSTSSGLGPVDRHRGVAWCRQEKFRRRPFQVESPVPALERVSAFGGVKGPHCNFPAWWRTQ